MHLKDLKDKSPKVLLEKAEELGVEDASSMRVQDLIFAIMKKAAEDDEITYGDGVDTQDKAPGKAMTYADKYALLKAYKIVTGEDPDQQHSPDTAMYDNANIKITKTKVQALEQAIQNANITKTQVDNVINYFNYNKLEEIQNKDYMEICNRLKALKGA